MLRITFDQLRKKLSDEGSGGYARRSRDCDSRLLGEILKSSLTKKQKCYIIMYYEMGMTVKQIAASCGVNKSTVSRTISRGRKRIADLMGAMLIGKRLVFKEVPIPKDSDHQ